MTKEPKYYRYDEKKDLYVITKSVNGKPKHFGSFKHEAQARLAVKIFKKTGWHIEDKWAVKAEVNEILGD